MSQRNSKETSNQPNKLTLISTTKLKKLPSLSLKVALGTLGLVAMSSSPASAGILGGGGVFSLFLECNNDGVSQVLGASQAINGWQYSHDAMNDNTDGYLYDIGGLATKQTNDYVYFVINGNTPLQGTGFDRDARQVNYGALFFSNNSHSSFESAQTAGDLFAINFTGSNESGVNELGVYQSVVGKSVGINNFGHRTYDNYANMVNPNVDNFFGDLDADSPYFNPEQGYNVIGTGKKVQNDGFTFLTADELQAEGFDQSQFAGENSIAFKVKQSALQYQPPLREQAEDLEVEWVWDDEFADIEAKIDAAEKEYDRLKEVEINPRNRENGLLKNAHPEYTGASELNSIYKDRRNLEKDLAEANKVLTYLEEKKENWDNMTPEERENAAPEDVWVDKDSKDLAFQLENTQELAQQIADINSDADGKLQSALEKALKKAEKSLNNLTKKKAKWEKLSPEEQQEYLDKQWTMEDDMALGEKKWEIKYVQKELDALTDTSSPEYQQLQAKLDQLNTEKEELENKKKWSNSNVWTASNQAEWEALTYDGPNATKYNKIENLKQLIAEVEAGEIKDKLDGAKQQLNKVLDEIRAANGDYGPREQEVKNFNDQKKAQAKEQKTQTDNWYALEESIRSQLQAKRKSKVEAIVAANNEAEKQQEEATGGPRTKENPGGIPENMEEYNRMTGNGDPQSVPEPSGILGFLSLGLLSGGKGLRTQLGRLRKQK